MTNDQILASVAVSGIGNPNRQVAHHDPHVKHPPRAVRVTAAGWFGPHGRPVEVGEKFQMPTDAALHARALGRIVFA